MMAQPQYLIKGYAGFGKKQIVCQTDKPAIVWKEITRTKNTRSVAGMSWREVEGTGKYNHNEFLIRMPYEGGTSRAAKTVPATAEGVKDALRRIREQEAAILDAIDAEIAELMERLKVKRVERQQALSVAWSKANVVRLNEAEAMAKEGTH